MYGFPLWPVRVSGSKMPNETWKLPARVLVMAYGRPTGFPGIHELRDHVPGFMTTRSLLVPLVPRGGGGLLGRIHHRAGTRIESILKTGLSRIRDLIEVERDGAGQRVTTDPDTTVATHGATV